VELFQFSIGPSPPPPSPEQRALFGLFGIPPNQTPGAPSAPRLPQSTTTRSRKAHALPKNGQPPTAVGVQDDARPCRAPERSSQERSWQEQTWQEQTWQACRVSGRARKLASSQTPATDTGNLFLGSLKSRENHTPITHSDAIVVSARRLRHRIHPPVKPFQNECLRPCRSRRSEQRQT